MSWEDILKKYLESKQYKEIERKICDEYEKAQVFPKKDEVFNAFKLTPYSNVKCVIVGQDPYHNDNQAMGLAFSVRKGISIPPSLKNIFKEIDREYGCGIPVSGDLTGWAEQGVLLLNSILTVRAHEPASHRKIGWEDFTDEVIRAVNKKPEPVVYMLWGNYAKNKEKMVTNPNHLVLKSGHPSPLSVYSFTGNDHFTLCNEFLKGRGVNTIDWSHSQAYSD